MSLRSSLFCVSSIVVIGLFGAGCGSSSQSTVIQSPPVISTTVESATTTPSIALPTAAILEHASGTVRIVRDGSTMFGSERMTLREGDAIDVSTTGSAVIVWPAYGRSTLDGGSQIVLTQATTTADASQIKTRVFLNFGRVWTRLERLLGKESTFSVRAGSVVATVRGTSFGVERLAKRVNVKVMESHVSVTRVAETTSTMSMANESPIGEVMMVGPEEMTSNMEGTHASIAHSRGMASAEMQDAFMLFGNAPAATGELQIQPDVSAPQTAAPPVVMGTDAIAPVVEAAAHMAQPTEPIPSKPAVVAVPTPSSSPVSAPNPTPVLVPQPASVPAPIPQPAPVPAPVPTPSPTPTPSVSTSSLLEMGGLNTSGVTGTVNW